MPAKVKVRILAGRNLPVMDKSSDASDAFVEVKLANTTYKTEVYRRSLNPFWNSEWFKFEVTDEELQDEPLQIRVMDYDTYSANDAIGKVYINLNPIIVNPNKSMSGWLPIYDTLHGIRGEINIMIKVNLFADTNRYRHSSCGVQFFFSDVPNGYRCESILGFVEELLVGDDPEYQWIDKIRTPRASNEARQTLFTKLSGEVQRKLGLKAEIFGGNAVIGYQQSFNLEGGSGIVGRGIGTAVLLSKETENDYKRFPTSQSHLKQMKFKNQQYTHHSSTINDRISTRRLPHSMSADFSYKLPKIISLHRIFNDAEPTYQPKSSSSSLEDNDKTIDSEKFSTELDETFTQTSPSINLNDKTLSNKIVTKQSSQSNKNLFDKLKPSNQSKLYKIFPIKQSLEPSTKLTRLLSFKTQLKSSSKTKQQPADKIETISPHTTTIMAPKRVIPDAIDIAPATTSTHAHISSSLSTDSSSKLTSSPTNATSTQNFILPTPTSCSTFSAFSLVETTTSSNGSTSNSDFPAPQKRRREKSGSICTSKDQQHLTIIEEHNDDDISGSRKGSLTAVKTKVSCDRRTKVPHLTREKDIDLDGVNDEDCNLVQEKTLSTCSSSTSMEEEDEPGYSSVRTKSSSTIDETSNVMSSNTIEATTTGLLQLSSSTPTTSLLTDDTIRITGRNDNKNNGDADDGNRQTAEKCLSKKHPVRRSESDLTGTTRCKVNRAIAKQETQESISSSKQVIRSNGTSSACFSRTTSSNDQVMMQKTSGSLATTTKRKDVFANSVQLIKAQQHLLQTMIRHQNQNLLTHSFAKAKAMYSYPNRIHMAEYPLITIKKFPDKMIKSLGGVVSVHSVKLLDTIISDEESETRDMWWVELRKEIKSHAKALNCNTILGYRESSQVLMDVCILSASGTAAVLNTDPKDISSSLCVVDSTDINKQRPTSVTPKPTSTMSNIDQTFQHQQQNSSPELRNNNTEDTKEQTIKEIDCSLCHTPLECPNAIANLADCSVCKQNKALDVLLMTIEPPSGLSLASAGSLVQARVCRSKRDLHGDASAKEIGDALPFVEYELYRQLVSKLKFKGMNCLFNLSLEVSVGENMIVGVATGTGCFVLGMPIPEPPQIIASESIKPSKLHEIQCILAAGAAKNREQLDLSKILASLDEYHRVTTNFESKPADHDNDQNSNKENETHLIVADCKNDELLVNKQSVSTSGQSKQQQNPNNNLVLEVDDTEDAEIIALLIDSDLPEGYKICNSETFLSIDLASVRSMNMFTQVMRSKIATLDQFQQQFDWLIQSLFVKLRHSRPCCLTNLNFVVDLPELNELQISVTGCLLGLNYTTNDSSNVAAISMIDDVTAQVSQLENRLSSSSSPSASSSSSSSASSTTSSSSSLKSSSSLSRNGQTRASTQSSLSSASSSLSADLSSAPEPSPPKPEPKQRVKLSSRFNAPSLGDSVRAVFKKQSTYPGAVAPALSGTESRMPPPLPCQSNNDTDMQRRGPVIKSASARKATAKAILSKVKHPLGCNAASITSRRDVTTTTTTLAATQQSQQPAPASNAPGKTRGSKSSEHRASIVHEQQHIQGQAQQQHQQQRQQLRTSSMVPVDGSGLAGVSVDITSLSYIPGAVNYNYLGNLSFSLVRESSGVRESGGLNAFIHCFLMECYAIVRAHVSALGGNAFLSFKIQQSVIFCHSNKNQAQCLFSVAGDAARVTHRVVVSPGHVISQQAVEENVIIGQQEQQQQQRIVELNA